MKTTTALIPSFLLPLLALSAPLSSPAIQERDHVVAALAAPLLTPRQSSSTENGLTTDPCKALTVIFARGTNEAGNVGSIAGPPFFSALRGDLGTSQVTVQGVPYDASFAGYFEGGSPSGSQEMLTLIQQASSKCPNTKLVLSGYSQGAQLVHNAAANLSAGISAQVVAVVVFGDPDRGQAVGTIPSSEVDSICHDQDIICTGQGSFTTHLTYGQDAASAASFVVSKSGL